MQMADKIVLRSVESLIPYARNARTHSDAQVAQIGGSIREFGFTNPVLVDGENDIVAGHGRVLAARKLGLTEVPCIEVAYLTDAQQRRAYIIADNKLALNAGWDEAMLKVELGELKLGGFDLSLTGFGELELDALLAEKTEGRADPDDVPETPARPVSEPGDLWLLGGHRLLCGDCTIATAYNLGHFMRTLAMPKTAQSWSLTSQRERLIKIGAKVVSHRRYVTFQMAEVAVQRQMFADILSLIARLRAPPSPA